MNGFEMIGCDAVIGTAISRLMPNLNFEELRTASAMAFLIPGINFEDLSLSSSSSSSSSCRAEPAMASRRIRVLALSLLFLLSLPSVLSAGLHVEAPFLPTFRKLKPCNYLPWHKKGDRREPSTDGLIKFGYAPSNGWCGFHTMYEAYKVFRKRGYESFQGTFFKDLQELRTAVQEFAFDPKLVDDEQRRWGLVNSLYASIYDTQRKTKVRKANKMKNETIESLIKQFINLRTTDGITKLQKEATVAFTGDEPPSNYWWAEEGDWENFCQLFDVRLIYYNNDSEGANLQPRFQDGTENAELNGRGLIEPKKPILIARLSGNHFHPVSLRTGVSGDRWKSTLTAEQFASFDHYSHFQLRNKYFSAFFESIPSNRPLTAAPIEFPFNGFLIATVGCLNQVPPLRDNQTVLVALDKYRIKVEQKPFFYKQKWFNRKEKEIERQMREAQMKGEKNMKRFEKQRLAHKQQLEDRFCTNRHIANPRRFVALRGEEVRVIPSKLRNSEGYLIFEYDDQGQTPFFKLVDRPLRLVHTGERAIESILQEENRNEEWATAEVCFYFRTAEGALHQLFLPVADFSVGKDLFETCVLKSRLAQSLTVLLNMVASINSLKDIGFTGTHGLYTIQHIRGWKKVVEGQVLPKYFPVWDPECELANSFKASFKATFKATSSSHRITHILPKQKEFMESNTGIEPCC